MNQINWALRKVLEEAMDCLATRSGIPPNSLPTTGCSYRGLQTVGQGQPHGAACDPEGPACFAHGNTGSPCDNNTLPVNSPGEKCPLKRELISSHGRVLQKNVLSGYYLGHLCPFKSAGLGLIPAAHLGVDSFKSSTAVCG